MLFDIAVPNWMRYRGPGVREQGTGNREQLINNQSKIPNPKSHSVYLTDLGNAIATFKASLGSGGFSIAFLKISQGNSIKR